MTEAANPFAVEGPAVISFSGGRTSAFMLRQILDAGLRPDVHVLFCNTGKEHEATLDFVHEIEVRWGAPVVWLEYHRLVLPRYKSAERRASCERARAASTGGRQYVAADCENGENWGPAAKWFRVVNHATAARRGEPFENLIELVGLPNSLTRLCTSELKIRTMARWMRRKGYNHWLNVVGLRADEPARIARMRAPTKQAWENELPLADAGILKRDVLAFWRAQPFDLGLPVDPRTGDTVGGNCDLCFLKGVRMRRALARADPARVDWWAEQERRTGMRFRDASDDYATLKLHALQPDRQCVLPLGDEDDLGDCVCHE